MWKEEERRCLLPATTSRGRSSAVVDVNQDLVRSTTCLGLVAVARVVATSSERVRTGNQAAAGSDGASVTLLVVLGTANAEAALCAGVEAVGDGGIVGTAGHAHGGGQDPTVCVVGVASHQVPGAIAGASVELADPCVVDVDGETVTSAASLSAVAAASHVAVGSLGAGGGCSVGAPALASVLGTCVLVTQALASRGALVGSVVASRVSIVGQGAGASVNEAAVGREACGKREGGGR